MNPAYPPAAEASLGTDQLRAILEHSFSFTDRPASMPADIRAEWRIALMLLVLQACRGGRASLQQLQVVMWAAIFPESRADFLRAYQGDLDPTSLLIRYDPAITRAIDLAVGLELVAWQAGKRLALTAKGTQLLDLILASEQALEEERTFLSHLGGKITMKQIDRMIGR